MLLLWIFQVASRQQAKWQSIWLWGRFPSSVQHFGVPWDMPIRMRVLRNSFAVSHLWRFLTLFTFLWDLIKEWKQWKDKMTFLEERYFHQIDIIKMCMLIRNWTCWDFSALQFFRISWVDKANCPIWSLRFTFLRFWTLFDLKRRVALWQQSHSQRSRNFCNMDLLITGYNYHWSFSLSVEMLFAFTQYGTNIVTEVCSRENTPVRSS